jgi:uncharacterized membrane protein
VNAPEQEEEQAMTREESSIRESIDVEVPISVAYDQWTQFEEFPHFMEGVEYVNQIDDLRLHWRAEIGGKTVEWDAEITDQVPDRKVAWRSITGARNAGVVSFSPLSESSCRITLDLDYEPEGFIEKVGDLFGMVRRRAKGDLERFREFIQKRGSETGAWRGTIPPGGTGTPGAGEPDLGGLGA